MHSAKNKIYVPLCVGRWNIQSKTRKHKLIHYFQNTISRTQRVIDRELRNEIRKK